MVIICDLNLTNIFLILQAEKIMEALELYKEETTKQNEHTNECKATGKQVCLTIGNISRCVCFAINYQN